jgi:hypothetical protein
MKLLSTNPENITIEFTRHELHLVNALVQEGRLSHGCDSPKGQALEDEIRTVVIRMAEAIKAGQDMARLQ